MLLGTLATCLLGNLSIANYRNRSGEGTIKAAFKFALLNLLLWLVFL